jgi:hypothetical protein
MLLSIRGFNGRSMCLFSHTSDCCPLEWRQQPCSVFSKLLVQTGCLGNILIFFGRALRSLIKYFLFGRTWRTEKRYWAIMYATIWPRICFCRNSNAFTEVLPYVLLTFHCFQCIESKINTLFDYPGQQLWSRILRAFRRS